MRNARMLVVTLLAACSSLLAAPKVAPDLEGLKPVPTI